MAFQPVPDVALARVIGRVDGQLTVNTLYWQVSGSGIDEVNLTTLANAVDNWANGSLVQPLSNDWAYERTDVIDLSAPNSFQVTVSSPAVGESSAEAAPNNVAACISFQTVFSGRSFRGRNYIPGIPNDQITLNTMGTPFMTSLTTIYGALIGAGTFVAGWQWGVVSRQSGGVPRVAGLFSPISGVVFKTPYVRSMRSREIGHGA